MGNDNENKPVYIVSGTERTGTSMMMYALISGGMDGVYWKDTANKQWNNPNGLYEIAGGYGELIYDHMLAGKLIKIFGRYLVNVDRNFKSKLKIVYMTRRAEEIVISYTRNASMTNIDKIKEKINKTDLARINTREKDIIEKIPEVLNVSSLLVFDYNWVVNNPYEAFSKLKEEGWNFDIDKAVETINQDYCHSKNYRKLYETINKNKLPNTEHAHEQDQKEEFFYKQHIPKEYTILNNRGGYFILKDCFGNGLRIPVPEGFKKTNIGDTIRI